MGAGFYPFLQCIALAVVVIIPMLMPEKFEAVQHYWVMPLSAPHIEAYKNHNLRNLRR